MLRNASSWCSTVDGVSVSKEYLVVHLMDISSDKLTKSKRSSRHMVPMYFLHVALMHLMLLSVSQPVTTGHNSPGEISVGDAVETLSGVGHSHHSDVNQAGVADKPSPAADQPITPATDRDTPPSAMSGQPVRTAGRRRHTAAHSVVQFCVTLQLAQSAELVKSAASRRAQCSGATWKACSEIPTEMTAFFALTRILIELCTRIHKLPVHTKWNLNMIT